MKSLLLRKLSYSLVWLTATTGILIGHQSLLFGQDTNAGAAPAEATQKQDQRTLDDFRKAMKSKGGMGGLGAGGLGSGGMSEGGMSMGSGMGGGMGAPPTEKQLLAQLIQKLRDRLNSKKYERQAVEKQLRAALKQYFDADMEERVKEFDRVKAQLAAMEAKLQRRLSSDQDIIELQLKQMLHKADGLDFSIPSGDFGGGGYGDGGGMGMGMGMGEMGGGGASAGGEGGMGMGMGMGMGPGGGMSSGGRGGGGLIGGAIGGAMGGEGILGGGGAYGGSADVIGSGASGYSGIPAAGLDTTPRTIGYDSSFGLTQVQRLDGEALDEQDPLELYMRTTHAKADATPNQSNADKLRTIISAFHTFDSTFHHMPRSANRHTKKQTPHSWRVAILPLIGYGFLYREYKFDQPWDSPDNLKVASKMPELYRSSSSKSKDSTPFQILVGEGAFDSSTTPPMFADITDGTSNTLAIIESNKEVVWTKPEDVSYHINGFLQLSESRLVAFADGHIQNLPKDLDANVLRALVSRAGGELVTIPESPAK